MSDEGEAKTRRRLTINDVARMAGVSKKTVSRVINRSPFVREDTRERVEAIMAETGYAPDPQARGLAFRSSFLIGMIYDNPNPQYVVNMQQGLLDGIRGSGFELVVHPCQRSAPDFLPTVRAFVERQKLFGVVLTPSVSEDEGVADVLRELGCPYIRIASVAVDVPARMLITHDHIGGLQAARHLAELGHRRMAFISGPPTFRSSQERLSGFREGLAEHGLQLAEDCVGLGAYTFESGVEAAAALLALEPRPTAIFAANDEMAAGALRAAREAGLSVPQDLSVVGYDDFQIAARVWPPLTTIHTPTRNVGYHAARSLIGDLADEQSTETIEAADLQPRIEIRASTAPPASNRA
jgi:LacI family transcriptional regulator